MPEQGRRATDLQTPERRGTGAREPPYTRQEEDGVEAFPVFSEPPFAHWSQRHRRSDYLLQRYPGDMPPIVLWDELGELPMYRVPVAHGAQHPPA